MKDNDRTILTFEAPEDNYTKYEDFSEANDVPKAAEPAPDAQAPYKKKRSSKKASSAAPQYVSKKFMIVCLVIAIIVSTGLGVGISAALLGGNSSVGSKSYDNLSESDLAAATGSKLTIAEIVAKNADAVVEIVVSGSSTNMFGQSQITEGAGSGVIVNEKGYIVTNYHVIEGANKVEVTLHNGDSYSAQIIGGDDQNDIAVIKINASDLTVAEFGDSSKLAVGDLAVAIGNPLGQLGGTATSGIVSALDRRLTIDDRTLSLIQIDAAINGGNSGGGLFNGAGQLIGIVDAKSSGVGIEGLAFAIPVNSVKDIINDLIENGKVSAKPVIGISIYDVSESNAQYYNLDGEGVYVAEVTGDNAQKAGFKEGDKIISINGKEIESSSDFISRVQENKIGDTVTVAVSRNGQKIKIKTVLEESNSTSSSKTQSQQSQQGQQGQQGYGSDLDEFFDQFF